MVGIEIVHLINWCCRTLIYTQMKRSDGKMEVGSVLKHETFLA